jgi:carboxypeptidase T
MKVYPLFVQVLMGIFLYGTAFAHVNASEEMFWAAIRAKNKEERTVIATEGFSIENIVEDISYGFAPKETLDAISGKGFEVISKFPALEMLPLDFPIKDAIYHNYAELTAELDKLASEFPKLVHKFSLGKSLEGREIWGIRINANADNAQQPSALPGIVFMGGHHAREHLSVEMPLRLARYLAESYRSDETIRNLLSNRDITIIPIVNPDGSEFDIEGGSYKSWRKNRAQNKGSSCAGVDLNRNYGYRWGTGGSSKSPCNDTYMGTEAFSEPETRAIKSFVESKPNIKILLSFHTFSELILYPWGHTYDDISDTNHLTAYRTMAQTMAQWNNYRPQPSSDLYITSGDTTDWAYGQLGIFSFTFELSPRDMWGGGGFYPGPEAVERTVQANLRPSLYLIDLADDPLRAAFRPETTLFYGRQ